MTAENRPPTFAEAFRWLEKTVRHRSGLVIYIKVDPWFDSLCPDPRDGEMLKAMGLE